MRVPWAFCAAAAGFAAACGGGDTATVVPVASMRFATAASSVVAGTSQTVRVEMLDADGSRARGANDHVTLTVSDGATFTGPSVAQAANGLAVFNGVALTHADSNIYLTATAGTYSATTELFTVHPGAPSALRSVVSSPGAQVVPTVPTPVSFIFADAYGNPVPGAAVTVSASGGASFSPDSGHTAGDGRYATSFRSSVGGNVSITATVNGATVALSTPLTVCANPVLSLPGSSSGGLTTNSCFASGRYSAFYRFSMAAMGAALFTVASQFTPRLTVATDPPLANAFASPNQGLPSEWLLPAGTYELGVSATAGVGVYALSAALGPGNSGCVRRYLATVGVYNTQTLAAGDCDYDGFSVVDKYVVYSPNPCSFRLHSTTFTNYIFLMELGTGHFLDGRGGEEIGTDALFGVPYCNSLGNPMEVWVLPDSGQAGSYTLTYTLYPIPGLRAGQVAAPISHERVAVDPRVLRRLRSMRR